MKLEISSSSQLFKALNFPFLARYLLRIIDRIGDTVQTGFDLRSGILEFSFKHGGWFVKIQNKYKMIISLCVFIGLAFFLDSHLREKSEPVVYRRPLPVNKSLTVKSMTTDDVSDLYCGILLMPKSMEPKLQQISRYGFAEDIKILPAKIKWDNGCMVAIAKDKSTPQNEIHPDQANAKDVRAKDAEPEKIAEKDLKKLNAALLYYFWANASKSQINH